MKQVIFDRTVKRLAKSINISKGKIPMNGTLFNRTVHRKLWTFLANPALYTHLMQQTVLDFLGDSRFYIHATSFHYKRYAVKVLSETDEEFANAVKELRLKEYSYCVGCATALRSYKCRFSCLNACQCFSACVDYDKTAWRKYDRAVIDSHYTPDPDLYEIAMAAYNIAFCDMDHPEEGYIDEMKPREL